MALSVKFIVRLEEKGLSDHREIEVLLATYNGERFLREQVDSILTQDHVNVRILARDDGSSDETVQILNEYAERYPARFQVMPPSPATGSAKDNFGLLMRASTASHICFADQDDVWLPDKVTKTIQAMEQLESEWGVDTPLLVFTDLHVVDDQLRPLHESFWATEKINPARINHLPLLLGQNVVTGCTAMLNRSLVELSLSMPGEAYMHDGWIALLACTIGKAAAVNARTVLYRQHDRNVIGVAKRTGSVLEIVLRLRNRQGRRAQWEINQQQAKALLRVHPAQLSAKHRELLRAYLRCGTTRSRLVRIATFLRYGFYHLGSSVNLAIMLDV